MLGTFKKFVVFGRRALRIDSLQFDHARLGIYNAGTSCFFFEKKFRGGNIVFLKYFDSLFTQSTIGFTTRPTMFTLSSQGRIISKPCC